MMLPAQSKYEKGRNIIGKFYSDNCIKNMKTVVLLAVECKLFVNGKSLRN